MSNLLAVVHFIGYILYRAFLVFVCFASVVLLFIYFVGVYSVSHKMRAVPSRAIFL